MDVLLLIFFFVTYFILAMGSFSYAQNRWKGLDMSSHMAFAVGTPFILITLSPLIIPVCIWWSCYALYNFP